MAREMQGDFFGDSHDEESKLKTFAKSIMPKRIPHLIQISMDVMIFLIIGIVFAIIIAFAFGMERGKRAYRGAEPKAPVTKILSSNIKEASKPIIPDLQKMSYEKKQTDSLPFTIQIMAYNDKSLAVKKAKEIKNSGIDVFIIKTGKIYKICSGSYASALSAQEDMKRLSRAYKGSFIKKKVE